MPVLVWAVDYSLGLRVGVMLLFSSSFNSILKMGFHQPRPYWYSAEVENLGQPWTGFGIPSGHSMTPVSTYGLLATEIKRNWAKVLIWVVIFLIGFSRLVLGAHFLQDVLAGWAFGFILLWLFLRYEERVKSWFNTKSIGARFGTIFGISVGLILVGALIVFLADDYTVPQTWQANAAHPSDEPIDPYNLDSLITSAGTLFGLVSGSVWLGSRGGFNDEGEVWKRLTRFLVGFIGVALLWKGLGSVFPREADLLSYSLRYLRYSLIGLWISGLAPALFMKFGLAKEN
jgi:membrane-associated phospholipid phosphatase